MMNPTRKKDASATDLSTVSFGDYVSEYSYEEALESGVLVKVTAWAVPEMGFAGDGRFRVQVAVTAQAFRAVSEIPPLAAVWQTTRGRGHDLLWVASYALRKARKLGREVSTFQAFVPTTDDEEDVKAFRVESGVREDSRPIVVVGTAEEFALL